MKSQLAALLAVAGWYLMTPPAQPNGRFDTSAPISKWRIEAGFASSDDCKKTVATLGSKAAQEGRPGDVEAIKNAQCVATDDPRLK